MTYEEAKKNVRILGLSFQASLEMIGKPVTIGKANHIRSADAPSPLLDGIVAYQYLNLEGTFDWLDESVSVVLNNLVDRLRDED
jgi:hypothetical protein